MPGLNALTGSATLWKTMRRPLIFLLFSFLTTLGCGGDSPNARNSAPVTESAQQLIGQEGFFRLAQADGVWWLVTPEGERFFSIGVNHIDPNLLLTEADTEASLTKYGADLRDAENRAPGDSEAAHKFMEESMDNIQAWGFNSLGGQNQVPQNRLPYVATFRPAIIENWPIKKSFPDPFSPATVKMVDEKASKWAATRKLDPLIIGVTTTAMPLWATNPDRIHEWVKTLMNLPAKAPGKIAFMKVLKAHYPKPEGAGAAYGVKAESWADLANRKKWPKPKDRARVLKDQDAMLQAIAAAWYPLVTQAVRKHMPNHLFLGDKIVPFRDLPEWLVPIVAENFDIMYFQWYDNADAQMARLQKIYGQTGKPVIMGDSSFAFPNERVPKPKGVPVENQAAVGTTYAAYMAVMANEPWFIGWHHCGYMEGAPDLARIGPLIARQNGFIRPDGTIYEETVTAVKAANKAAFGQHMAAKGVPTQAAATEPGPTPAPAPDDNPTPVDITHTPAAVVDPLEPLTCIYTENDEYRFNQVGDRIFELRMLHKKGSPGKPVSWIIGNKGVLVYDTGSAISGVKAHNMIREQTDLPILYIVYSHHHGTQLTGARNLIEEGTKVIAHEDLVQELRVNEEFKEYFERVNSIQFNTDVMEKDGAIFPDVSYTGIIEIDLGGVVVELRHMSGEAEGYTVLYMPQERIVWMADLLPGGMPMVASPMKVVRSEVNWQRSLETVAALNPRGLLYTGSNPLCDPQEIQDVLGLYIRLFEFLHTSIVREINLGHTAEEAVANIQLPPDLQNQPGLMERYGTLEFAVRGLHYKYSGWFDQNGTNIKPAPAKALAAAMVEDMGGRAKVLERAKQLRAAGKDRLATEYADLLINSGKSPAALLLKADALDSLAEKDDSGNRIVKGMLRRSAINCRQEAKKAAQQQ